MSVTTVDVLVIGAGLAGQRAALAAADSGASTAIVSKVHPVRSHSVAAAGGINASLGEGDTWEEHAHDTVKGSDYLGDQDAIEVMCRVAPGEVVGMERLGVPFHRDQHGRLAQRPFGGAPVRGRATSPTSPARRCCTCCTSRTRRDFARGLPRTGRGHPQQISGAEIRGDDALR